MNKNGVELRKGFQSDCTSLEIAINDPVCSCYKQSCSNIVVIITYHIKASVNIYQKFSSSENRIL